MEIKNFSYLFILIAITAVTLIVSYNGKSEFYKNQKYILPAILLTAIVFVLWDISFTNARVWGFYSENTIGLNLKGLPIEEWLFFLIIPFASIFVYEFLKVKLAKHEYANHFLVVSLLLLLGFGAISYFFRYQSFTFLTSLFSAVYLGYTVFRNQFKQHITKFYFCYFVTIIPYIFIESALNSIPVIEYNASYIVGIKIINTPIERFAYYFLMLLMGTTIYEFLKAKRYY